MFLTLQNQKRSHDHGSVRDREKATCGRKKGKRVQINNGRIDPNNAQNRAKCEAETLIIRKDYERERKRVEKQKLRIRSKLQVSL